MTLDLDFHLHCHVGTRALYLKDTYTCEMKWLICIGSLTSEAMTTPMQLSS